MGPSDSQLRPVLCHTAARVRVSRSRRISVAKWRWSLFLHVGHCSCMSYIWYPWCFDIGFNFIFRWLTNVQNPQKKIEMTVIILSKSTEQIRSWDPLGLQIFFEKLPTLYGIGRLTAVLTRTDQWSVPTQGLKNPVPDVVIFRKILLFFRWGIVTPYSSQGRSTLLSGYPRLPIQYLRIYPYQQAICSICNLRMSHAAMTGTHWTR